VDNRHLQLKIIGACVCITVAIALFFLFKPKPDESTTPEHLSLICTNDKCGSDITVSRNEYINLVKQSGYTGAFPNQILLTCSKCGQKSVRVCEKCIKCGKLFLLSYGNKDYPDRCPQCDYSKMEQRFK